jgi:hypothetical protein
MLRRYLEARGAGDAAGARHWWGQVLTVNYERLKTLVYLESRDGLDRDEQEEAVQRVALVMATKRVEDFRGTSMGEWINLLKQVVHGVCIDTQRAAARRSRHRAALETTGADGDLMTSTEADQVLAREAAELEEDLRAQEELLDLGRDFLAWARPQLTEDQRTMIDCDLAGLPIDEAQRRLARKRDAVYQLRRRTLKRLMELREEYEA